MTEPPVEPTAFAEPAEVPSSDSSRTSSQRPSPTRPAADPPPRTIFADADAEADAEADAPSTPAVAGNETGPRHAAANAGTTNASPARPEQPEPARADVSREPAVERGRAARSSIDLIESCADFALAAAPFVVRVLDVGCGDGSLLREIALRVPYGEVYCGVDPDETMLAQAALRSDPRIDIQRAEAAQLPFADDSFDLVTTVRSFHLWADQVAGLRELARVVRPTGHIVVVDRLADGAKSRDRIRSRKAMRAAAEEVGLRVNQTEVVTRRFLWIPDVRAFVLNL